MSPDLKRLCEAAAAKNTTLSIDYERGYCASDDAADWEEVIRAVLTELRKPSEDMADAGGQVSDGQQWGAGSIGDDTAVAALTAMIDRILAEPATT